MDEILKAIVGLINTGNALANDALYLYFALKVSQAFAVVAFAYTVLKGVGECIRIGNNSTAQSQYLRVLAYYAEIQPPHPFTEKWMEEAKRAYDNR